ncbi:DJ-1/PfpI family protein [Nocardia cyriacigeorgica]|uniref:DJ-1/PfpI family protein n=1 Tax=Nocardia cyriacigeorgica TaxID=135487 RepID=UPI00226BCF4E|nr:DJ-1/PfpI family protein [Nocardia cyriacigeorgica]
MLLYPECTALDFVGPQYAFACLEGARVHHVAATMDPVITDTGLSLLPTATFEQCPLDLDVLFVPGGTSGTLAAMRDDRLVQFLIDRGAREVGQQRVHGIAAVGHCRSAARISGDDSLGRASPVAQVRRNSQ